MARVKRGNVARKRRKKILKLAKGFRGGLSKLFRPASQSVLHSLSYKYRDRRLRKRDFRKLWISRINGALTNEAISYSVFINKLKQKNVLINRKMLAELAVSEADTFKQVVGFVSK